MQGRDEIAKELLDELLPENPEDAVKLLEELNILLMRYDSAIREVRTKLEILNDELSMTSPQSPIASVTSRRKKASSIFEKLKRQGDELSLKSIEDNLNDVAGVRVICSFVDDIYKVARMLVQQDDISLIQIKDYIQNPKPNGYMSYHMIVTVPVFLSDRMVETKAEIQIRTIAMDFWASLEHKIYYKFEGHAPDYIRRELKECAELVAFLDKKMLSINEEIKEYARLEEFKAMAAGALVSVQESVMGNEGREEEAYQKEESEEEILSDYREIGEGSGDDMGMLEAMEQRVISENAGVYQTGNPDPADAGKDSAGKAKGEKKQGTYTDKVPFVGELFAGGKKKKKRDIGLNGA